MNWLLLIVALLPIAVIFGLLAFKRTPADLAGLAGWVLTVLAAWLVFKTPLEIIFKASLTGVLASLPIALVVATSIFQITIMLETGAIARVVAVIKTISPNDKVVQIMLINIGFGTLLTALGAVPVSILPPIMLALGYSSFTAIALPAIGYDALTTYALLGIPVVVFANFVGLEVGEAGGYFARFMPVISTCIAFGMLFIVGRWKMMVEGFIPAILAGVTAGLICVGMNALGLVTLTGIAAGLAVIVVMLAYLKLTGRALVDRSKRTQADRLAEAKLSLLAAVSPWVILTGLALLVNAPFLPFFELTFQRWSMPVEIIPGAPEKVRLLWQAYFWILVSTLLALPFLRPTRESIQNIWQKWLRRAPRPVFAAAVFFAIAFVMNHSGKDLDWQLAQSAHNMIQVMADASARAFGRFYPVATPFLGLLGGFISGSETSSIAMLTSLHLSTAQQIGASGLLIAAASGVGGGLASVISPAKLQNASAAIDRIGEEAEVIRVTFVISIVITAVAAIMTLIWAY